jgi:DNA-binding response OmpR family regulator
VPDEGGHSEALVNPSPAQVLIVDDNEDAASSLAMLLELEDITAAAVADAEAALQYLQTSSPALLLIDIGLPGMDGYELAARVRQVPGLQAATLIALSGREVDAGFARGTAFDQFWTKPFDPKRLLAEVQLVLSRHSAESA